MITFFDKKTQDFLTVFTKYPPSLIETLKDFEQHFKKSYSNTYDLPHIGGHLHSILKFTYNLYFEEDYESAIFYDEICFRLETEISFDVFLDLHRMLCKYGNIENVGRYLYLQKEPDVEKELLKEFNITLDFDPLPALRINFPYRVKEIECLLDEDSSQLEDFDKALHSFAEELSKFSEITANKKLLNSIDKIFSRIEKIYVDTFDDIYHPLVLQYAFSCLTFGVYPPVFFGDGATTTTSYLTNKLCAKILKHPVMYHYYFQDIIRDQGVHNDFFYRNARKEAEAENEDLVKNLSIA